MSAQRGLATWVGTRLAALVASIVAIILGAVLTLVLLPLSARSADDLASLMVLSAQTWTELPPATREDFLAELLARHQMSVRTDLPAPAELRRLHGFYLGFIEDSLRRRGGDGQLFEDGGPSPGLWIWTHVPTGDQRLAVGFAEGRSSTRPLIALAVIALAASLLVVIAARWMALRIAEPIQQLERAAAQMSTGSHPDAMAEQGPRELAQLARHFNTMARHVHELIDARTTLLAGVSHDLRTPLARMRLALEMLTLQPRPELIARLERDIEDMNRLIGQLLLLARGLAPQASAPLELEPWLRDRAERLGVPGAQSPVDVQCPSSLWAQAEAETLGRIVDNLLGNAARHAPGPISLIAERRADGPLRRVRIAVCDRGPGIPVERMPAVWQPFERLDPSRSPASGGFGLGLALVRQLAQSLGWQTGMAARDGGGLSVWVELDEAEPPAQPQPNPSST